ncbi:MAG: response regulator [Negativicutes bacterium]|nr:response regulator [Negativicutes bacterium]
MKIKVLIVDDSRVARAVLTGYVNKIAGFAVVAQAANGGEAVETYEKVHPDIVFMDVVMPGMDGITALKKILESHADAKVIVLSAMDDDLTVKKAFLAGAKAFLPKPYEQKKLVTILNDFRSQFRVSTRRMKGSLG